MDKGTWGQKVKAPPGPQGAGAAPGLLRAPLGLLGSLWRALSTCESVRSLCRKSKGADYMAGESSEWEASV